jgi:transcriptional regulator with XRE-family HTH domain
VEGDLQRAFGRNLRTHRESLGYSQERFAAEILHIHRTLAGAIERGERNLTLRTVERLAERAGVPVLDLLRSTD